MRGRGAFGVVEGSTRRASAPGPAATTSGALLGGGEGRARNTKILGIVVSTVLVGVTVDSGQRTARAAIVITQTAAFEV